jgi:hypothetical protein
VSRRLRARLAPVLLALVAACSGAPLRVDPAELPGDRVFLLRVDRRFDLVGLVGAEATAPSALAARVELDDPDEDLLALVALSDADLSASPEVDPARLSELRLVRATDAIEAGRVRGRLPAAAWIARLDLDASRFVEAEAEPARRLRDQLEWSLPRKPPCIEPAPAPLLPHAPASLVARCPEPILDVAIPRDGVVLAVGAEHLLWIHARFECGRATDRRPLPGGRGLALSVDAQRAVVWAGGVVHELALGPDGLGAATTSTPGVGLVTGAAYGPGGGLLVSGADGAAWRARDGADWEAFGPAGAAHAAVVGPDGARWVGLRGAIRVAFGAAAPVDRPVLASAGAPVVRLVADAAEVWGVADGDAADPLFILDADGDRRLEPRWPASWPSACATAAEADAAVVLALSGGAGRRLVLTDCGLVGLPEPGGCPVSWLEDPARAAAPGVGLRGLARRGDTVVLGATSGGLWRAPR